MHVDDLNNAKVGDIFFRTHYMRDDRYHPVIGYVIKRLLHHLIVRWYYTSGEYNDNSIEMDTYSPWCKDYTIQKCITQK